MCSCMYVYLSKQQPHPHQPLRMRYGIIAASAAANGESRRHTWHGIKEMEKCLASVDFSEFGHGKSLDGGVVIDDNDSGAESCEETRKMVLKQNRKGKKSGGFQSMGKLLISVCQSDPRRYTHLSGLSYAVFSAVMKKGYRVPTPIQRKVKKLWVSQRLPK